MNVEELLHKQVIILDTKPWSSYSEADYTLQQWHNACLIHLHDGPPTSKAECKLPVKTPNGVVNKNGVFAAAAALAGARSSLKAPDSEKASARKTLIRLYGEMGSPMPPSLMNPSMMQSDIVENILEHHGIKGQRWGVRKSRSSRTTSSEHRIAAALKKKKPSELTNKQLQTLNTRLNLERKHKQLNPSKIISGRTKAEFILGTIGVGVTAFNVIHSPAGKAVMNLGKKSASKQLRLFKP